MFRWFQSKIWYKHDKTLKEGAKIDALTWQFKLQQIIKELTHVLAESFYCIDSIFMSHQSLAVESGIWNPHCYRLMSSAKFSLKIHYAAYYKREIRHYDQANVDHVRKAVNLFPCRKALQRNRSQRKWYDFLFNKTAENIISKYIPHETVTFDDRDRDMISKSTFRGNFQILDRKRTVS